MLKTFTKGEKKLSKGLKIEYSTLWWWKARVSNESWDRNRRKRNRRKKKKKEREKKQEEQDKEPFDLDEFIEQIFNREKLPINNELFKKHFKLEKPILMQKVLNETKNYKEKNSKLFNMFNSGLEDLEKEIKKMSKEEIEIEKPST